MNNQNEKYFIALPVKRRISDFTQLETLDEALHSLLDVASEL